MTDVVAALDCGSNSTRLLITDADGVARRREMRITRLSEGVDSSRTLSEPAMARTLDVLAQYRTMMDEEGVTRGLLAATSAVRDASNGADFLSRARDVTGVTVQVLSGEQEAAFSYNGATAGLEPDARVTMIVDVGGGSTELAARVDGRLVSASMQLGCVRLSERALGHGVVDPEHDEAARAMIAEQLDWAFERVGEFATLVGDVRLIGLAGTVSTLAQLDARLAHYDRDAVHHRHLSRSTVEWWRTTLSNETPDQRLARAGMVPGRQDVIHAGLYVLAAVMDRFEVAEVLSSESDILDGVCASLLGE